MIEAVRIDSVMIFIDRLVGDLLVNMVTEMASEAVLISLFFFGLQDHFEFS
jgi:hypothetical protein